MLDLLAKIESFWLVTTKYNPGNLALLIIGIMVALAGGWLPLMMLAFGAGHVHDLRSGILTADMWASLVLVPACLITFRWPKIGATISWTIAALCCVSAVWVSSALLDLIPATIEGLIATAVASRSQ